MTGVTASDETDEQDHPVPDAVEFLTRSPHRVEVLGALAVVPRTRHELKGRSEVSRVAFGRLFDNFGWTTHENGQNEATPQGRIFSRNLPGSAPP